jgi:hypothetical protein
MNIPNTITEARATSDVIESIVGRIEDTLQGESSGVVIIALLSLVILLQKPDCTPEQLQTLIRDTSRFICLGLDGVEVPINPSQIN